MCLTHLPWITPRHDKFGTKLSVHRPSSSRSSQPISINRKTVRHDISRLIPSRIVIGFCSHHKGFFDRISVCWWRFWMIWDKSRTPSIDIWSAWELALLLCQYVHQFTFYLFQTLSANFHTHQTLFFIDNEDPNSKIAHLLKEDDVPITIIHSILFEAFRSFLTSEST